MKRYLAFDIGGTFVKYGILDSEGEILSRGKVPTEREDLAAFMGCLSDIASKARAAEEISGIAVSMAGVLDVKRGFAYNGGAVTAIRDYPFAGELSRHCGHLPVSIENDAKAALLAEYWKGNLQGVANAVAFIIGTGIGGAVLANGQLLRGAHFFAGEFSYLLRENEGGERLLGDWETGLGMPAFLTSASRRLGIEEPLNGEAFFEHVANGDSEARACLDQYARSLAVWLANVCAVADPERIVIGGGVSVQPALIEAIRTAYASLSKEIGFGNIPVPDILPCKYFNDANLIGALYAHLEQRKEQEKQEKAEVKS